MTPPHYTNSQNSIISFGYVDSYSKIVLISYPYLKTRQPVLPYLHIYIQRGEDIAFFPLGAHKCKIAIFIPTCSCHKINQKMWHFNMWGILHLHILFFKTSFRTRFFMTYSTTWWCAKLIQLCLLIHSKKKVLLENSDYIW